MRVNKQTIKKMVQCVSSVAKKNIVRQTVDGIEHIIVSSYTLPDDIVMNDILYPASEIEKSYQFLERTLAPVEHPTNSHGEFISATDPHAIHNFYAGAYNVNVTRENGRVHVEKHINVAEALKTDRGKRLLDRIDELETNEKPRPIHTSVGIFLTVEKCKKPKMNAAGQSYTMIARNMVPDHDAILLDSIGAATPEQGVGMAVNSNGEKVTVDRVMVTSAVKAATGLPLADSGATWSKGSALKRVKAHIGAEDAPNATYASYHLWYDAANSENFGAYKLPFVDIIGGTPKAVPAALRNAAARLSQTDGPSDAERTRIKGIIDGYLSKLKTSAMTMSYSELMEKVYNVIKDSVAADWLWIVDLYDDRVIFETAAGYFQAPYTLSGENVTLAGIPIRVEKVVEYQPKVNQKQGGDPMKELILKALAEAGIPTEGLSDKDLMAAYNKLITDKQSEGDDAGGDAGDDNMAQAITNALKPLSDRIDALSVRINAESEKEKDDIVKAIVASKKYPGLTEDGAKQISLDTLKAMAAICNDAHGIPFAAGNENQDNGFGAPTEMPE